MKPKKTKKPGVQNLWGQVEKIKLPRSKEEFQLQCDCREHFDRYYPHLIPVFFHVVNQAVINDKNVGLNLWKLGRRRGVWDMKLQVPKGEWWGIWFEFKSQKGDLTDEQKRFRDLSRELGCLYKWVEIKTRFDFAREMAEYLEDKRFKF